MSFFDSLKQSLTGAAQSMNTELKKYRSKDLMQAIVASATLMAYADGEVTAAEKQKLLGYMRNSEQMSVFETDKVIEAFNQYVGRFDFDATIATGEVLQKLAAFKNKPEAQLIARVCLAIANADGQFDAAERKTMDKICQTLGLDSATVL
ncbi:tellurite resistance TerB family protein [Simplicispira psychrophila]|uniref:tellurite resistance TerB family protein n=1 Tax=Simplicispira psychrophila TaxID=80882 RepID=UPI0004852E0F|nr:tellurite resistance TerB family protein [Simplicispira psychrophila]